MLKTLKAPPQPGTLRESVLTLLMGWQESIEHAKFRALSQLIVDKDKGVEAFEEYMKIAFPYLEAAKRKERAGHIEKLQQEVKRGALMVRAMQMPTLKSRVASARAARGRPKDTESDRKLYRKIGRSL